MPDEDPNTPKPEKPTSGPETFSKEYVHELREENKGWRQKLADSETARQAAEAAAKKAKDDADASIAAHNSATTERVIRAEMKAAALKAGMIDLDGLKLADLSKIKLKDDGSIEGADELLTALKEAKPYLFGEAKGSSHAGDPPKPKTPAAKNAKDMTAEEYAVARRAIR